MEGMPQRVSDQNQSWTTLFDLVVCGCLLNHWTKLASCQIWFFSLNHSPNLSGWTACCCILLQEAICFVFFVFGGGVSTCSDLHVINQVKTYGSEPVTSPLLPSCGHIWLLSLEGGLTLVDSDYTKICMGSAIWECVPCPSNSLSM